MIQKDLSWCRYFITDQSFGPVTVSDSTFAERFEKTFHLRPARTIFQDQKHTNHIEWVSLKSPDLFLETDGLITAEKNLLLMMKSADCVPILLWNELEKIVAVLHCGWKGFFKGIVEAFCQRRDINPQHFSAFLGPHIRKASFTCQQDFLNQIPPDKKNFLDHDHYDLSSGVKSVLEYHGVSVSDSGIDTFTSTEYFSYRKMGPQYSTFASCIMITP